MTVVLDVLASAAILAGVLLAVIAGIGLQRFDDVFARMHSATKPATLGLMLVLIGAALRMDRPGDIAKLLLIVVLQLITAPIGAHMVGRATYRAGTDLSPYTTVDELAERRAGERGAAGSGADPTSEGTSPGPHPEARPPSA